jgi:transcriptional regulator with XRE-family HTH domain
MMTLGEYIRYLREKEHDLSLREFAKKLKCSPAFISDVELGRRYPSDKVLAEIARILRVSIEGLKKYDTRPPIDEIKRATAKDPGYALAFRTMIDKKISSEKLMEFIEKASDRGQSSHRKKK